MRIDLQPWPCGIEPKGADIYSLSRQALADGADPAETIETYRSGVLSMSGTIGELAKWAPDVSSRKLRRWKAVLDTDSGPPGRQVGTSSYPGSQNGSTVVLEA